MRSADQERQALPVASDEKRGRGFGSERRRRAGRCGNDGHLETD
jgi:hypothetical protein